MESRCFFHWLDSTACWVFCNLASFNLRISTRSFPVANKTSERQTIRDFPPDSLGGAGWGTRFFSINVWVILFGKYLKTEGLGHLGSNLTLTSELWIPNAVWWLFFLRRRRKRRWRRRRRFEPQKTYGLGAWVSSKWAKAGSIPKEAPLMLEGLMESSLKLGGPDCSLRLVPCSRRGEKSLWPPCEFYTFLCESGLVEDSWIFWKGRDCRWIPWIETWMDTDIDGYQWI